MDLAGGEVDDERKERIGLLRADRELRELELARERGEFMSLTDIEKIMTDLVVMTKARILAVPNRIAPQLGAHLRRFDAVVVWKFDRFARSVSHLLRALETFRALGIEFVSLSEQVDTSTPAGKLVFTVLGAVAELERSLIAERVRAGLRNARAKGKTLGRPRKLVNSEEINRLRAQGASWRAVGTALGVSAATAFCTSARTAVKTSVKGRR